MNQNHVEKDQFAIYAFIVVLLACFLIGYWPIFQKMSFHWSHGDNSYCYLVIPLFIYLCWDRRERFRFNEFSWDIWGILPIIFFVGLILVGELGSVVTLLYIGTWGCAAGTIFLIYGRRTRLLAFPLLILLFIVPLPPYVNRTLTFELKLAASSLATFLLRTSGVSVFQDGNIIDLGITQLQVVDACSGLRYLIPLFLLALLIGHFFSKGLWRKVVLLFFVVPVSVFLNSFRIWVTGILTIKGHGELAENLFHDFAGWLIFMIAGVMIFGVTLVLKRIRFGHKRTKTDDPWSTQVKGMTKPIVPTIIVGLIFVTSGYALKQIPEARNLPQRENFKSFPMQIGKWEGRRSYISKEILDKIWADDYVQATYFKPNTRTAIHVLIPFYEYQGTRHTAHAPQSCMLGGGWALTQSKERAVKLGNGQDITLMTMNLEKGNSKILGSYFFFMRGRVITSPWLNKLYLMWDSFSKQRTDGALVRAEMVVAPGQSMEDAWVELEEFIADLWEVLPRYVPE